MVRDYEREGEVEVRNGVVVDARGGVVGVRAVGGVGDGLCVREDVSDSDFSYG